MRPLFALLLITLLACAPQNQLTDQRYEPPSSPEPIIVRPEVPRVEPPPEESQPSSKTAKSGLDGAAWTEFLNTDLFTRPVEQGILVGDAAHPFLFGMRVGELLPVLTRNELGMLATPAPVVRGRALVHENLVRLDFGETEGGVLRFTQDPESGTLRSELYFAEDEPMLEYAYLLHEGSFPLLLERRFVLFGNEYAVVDVSNSSLELERADGGSVVLVDGSTLRVNGTRIRNTEVAVDPWSIVIRYTAPDIDDDGIRLQAGESLSGKLQPGALLNEHFDITYEGLERNVANTVRFESRDERVTLRFHDVEGRARSFDLIGLRGGAVRFGDEESALRVTECATPCIAPGERFLVTGRDGVSRILEYSSLATDAEEATFRDKSFDERHIVELEEGPSLLDGALLLATPHRLVIDPTTELLSFDMDGDGLRGSKRLLLVAHEGYEIQFPDQTATERLIDVVSPPLNGIASEELTIRVAERGGVLRVGLGQGPELVKAEDARFWAGTTERGILVTLEDSGNGILGEELTIHYPSDYRAGLVRVRG